MKKINDNYFAAVLRENDACLAPLAGVSDLPFRLICLENGADLMVTEMVSAKGLYYNNGNTKDLLLHSPQEKNTGVQIFGSDPAVMSEAVKRYLNDTPFSFLDINMGCPVRKVTSNGDGSALLGDWKKMEAVTRAVVEASTKPVSVKIRIGLTRQSVNCVQTAKILEDCGVSAIAVHGRTKEQMYTGNADWDKIAQVKLRVSIPVIANGDVYSVQSYKAIKAHTGCDGVMIGRGAMGNPFLFRQIASYRKTGTWEEVSSGEKLETALRHFTYLLEYKCEKNACAEFRKQLAWYTKGMPGSAKLRGEINSIQTKTELYTLINSMTESFADRIEEQ